MEKIDNPNIINRAGLIPFFITKKKQIKMMFMVPHENEWIPDLPQISKGRVEPGEIPIKAAIREAEEELGLKRSNLLRIEPVGQFSTIMIFIGQVKDPNDFNPPDPIETRETVWLTYDEFLNKGRTLHIPVVEAAVNKIKDLFDEIE